MKKKILMAMSLLAIFQWITVAGAQEQTNEAKPLDGYTLFSPLNGTTTYLIDMNGDVVHTWDLESAAAFSTYFLDNGHLLRSASKGGGMGFGMGGFGGRQRGAAEGGPPGGIGAGGKIQEIDWDGNVVWEYEYSTDTQVPHHDIEKMPNGNILMVCWDAKSDEEAIAAGRKPEYQTGELHPDAIVEIKPVGDNEWEVVWEWRVWDHLVQDFDAEKPNYGDVSAHPERIDINYSESWADKPSPGAGLGNQGGARGFGGGGTFGGMGGGGSIPISDWTHLNAVDYNEELDLIVVSSYTFSEFWVIDHSTTKEEAKGHSGGKHGKGGDLIYRWGNPAAYKQGTNDDQTLFRPHNIHWIADGLPGDGHMLIFNNGPNRQDGQYSSVEEFILPLNEEGRFIMEGKTFAAVKPVWKYVDPNDKTRFYSMNISGAQRLPNGNTLICEGPKGHLFEVTPDAKTVWEYTFSASGDAGGAFGGMGGGRMGQGAGAFGGNGGFGMRTPGNTSTNAVPATFANRTPRPAQGAPANATPRGNGGATRGGMGMGGMGGGMANQIFRATRIPADHPGLKGKTLAPEKEDAQPLTQEDAQ
ncbi:MAG: aryl-sulfate sulfotransferase [Pontiellaceae bacterium]|nr:aryl-sulfate sulfotransferase [Pontiellaceae bacterium]